MKTEIFGIVLAVLFIGVYGATRQCYQCSVDTNPMKSDCWNNTDKENAEGVTKVECEYACFSETFQSGGDYWYVTKGCSTGCSGSKNCFSPHWGKCVKCCSGELCNTEAPGSAVGVTASVMLSLLALLTAKLLQ